MEAKKRKAEEKDSLSRYVRPGLHRGLCWVGRAEGEALSRPRAWLWKSQVQVGEERWPTEEGRWPGHGKPA